jgi:uncharacterized membrane protein YfcA
MDRRILSTAIGFFTGFSGGLLGIGGGVVLVPLSVLLLHIDQRKAQGLSLLNMVFVTPVGAAVYLYSKGPEFSFPTVLAIAVGAVLGARFGAGLAQKASLTMLRRLFSVLLAVTGVRMLIKTWMRAHSNGDPIHPWLRSATPLALFPIQVTGGFLVGCLAGLFGIGGGVLYVVLLQFALGFGAHAARGMSLAIVVPSAFFACRVYAKRGNLPFDLIPPILAGSLPGILLGSLLALRLSAPVLNIIFGVFLVLMALRMAFGGGNRNKLRNP